MKGYVANIEELTANNTNFRQVVYTASHQQLVLMMLQPSEEIGMEVHETVDQFFRIESGEGKIIMDGEEATVGAGFAIVVPAGTQHNLVNTSATNPLKLYTIYTPPQHRDGTVHATKADAAKDTEDKYQG